MKRIEFFKYTLLATLVVGTGCYAHGGGNSDGGKGIMDTFSSMTLPDMDWSSIESSGISNDTLELEDEELTPEQIKQLEREKKEREQFWSGLESDFWNGVSGLMSAGEFGSKVLTFGSGVALATLAAPGTVVITSGGVVVGTITTTSSVAIGTAYSVATNLAQGNSMEDSGKAGLQTAVISVVMPNASPLVQGLTDLGTSEVRDAMPDELPSQTRRSPTYSTDLPNYNGTTQTNTGQTLYY
jgi:hypothetical protein